ncbi:MAG TPA: hypothetical protein VL981_02005 [Candidatus Methylacidiphilales bacterium]|nr:hypothetical protein [Candidatus Methylacidiphilales bacterium]
MGTLACFGVAVEEPVTPKMLDPGNYIFLVLTKPTQDGVAYHMTITAKSGAIPPDSEVSVSLKTTFTGGGGSFGDEIGPVTSQPSIKLHKDDHVWTIDFVVPNTLVKNPNACFIFTVPAHAFRNGQDVPMPGAEFYEIKLQDFVTP